VKAGNADNFYIAPGDSSDYFGLKSINIAAGSDSGGAFSATLTDITGRGRNLDFILVAKNPYIGKNGNTQDHVIFQSRNVLSRGEGYGHYMNLTNTNIGGYKNSKGRAFVINQVKNALIASGIPLDDPLKCPILSRRGANRGPGATAADIIEDSVFLAAYREVWWNAGNASTYETEDNQTHFSFYSDTFSMLKYAHNGIVHRYWLASPSPHDVGCFYAGGTGGITPEAISEMCIAPAFAVG
jgi:hypothetical protein